MNISERLFHLPASPIRKLVPFAQKAKREGVSVLHLNIGDPDIKTPKQMLSALTGWTADPIGYDLSQGNPEFIKALAGYYGGLGFTFVSEDMIQVTTGGSEAISMALFATCAPGDEVLVFEPFYANYNTYALINGVKLVPLTTRLTDGFHLPDRQTIEKMISAKTRAILICNPNNPTGTVYTKAEMDMLAQVAADNNLFLLSDEVYREYTYDGRSHISVLRYMEKHPDRMILLDSMSKRYSVCGLRLGMLVSANRDIMAGVLRYAQGRLSSGFVDQVVGSRLSDVPKSYFKTVHEEYEARRDLLYNGLRKIPGVSVPKPEGAFYVIAALPVENTEDFCAWLLTDFRYENTTVMLAPAAGFYATPGFGQHEVRIAYVLNREKLTQALKVLTEALKVYPRRRK